MVLAGQSSNSQPQEIKETPASIEADLGLTPDELAVVLDLGDGVDPANTWLLRDYLGAKIREAGRTPRAYITLTEDRRADADRWFGIGSKSQF